MISIEADEIGFKRAQFNQPFATVQVKSGYSNQVLPMLLTDPKFNTRPWCVWLDFDGHLQEDVVDDIRLLVEEAPKNSILIVTFNASGQRLGKPADRPDRLRQLLGAVVPDSLNRDDCRDDRLSATLIKLTADYITSKAASVSRPGGFVTAFCLPYQDTAPMVTVGGVLPAKGAASTVRAAVAKRSWPGIVHDPIIAPHLTLMEAAVLQAELPRRRPLTRAKVKRLGFDLEEDQIKSFERYYLHYPTFVQIIS